MTYSTFSLLIFSKATNLLNQPSPRSPCLKHVAANRFGVKPANRISEAERSRRNNLENLEISEIFRIFTV